MMGQMKRHQPLPLVQPSGLQPYHGAMARFPGPALDAMQGGRTLFGMNPADTRRALQVASRRRPASLLESLVR